MQKLGTRYSGRLARILTLAFALALGACAEPVASSGSPDLSSEVLPPGLRHTQLTSTWVDILGNQEGVKQWSVLIAVNEPIVAVEGVKAGRSEEVNAYARRLIDTLDEVWGTVAAPRTAKAIEALLHDQPIPNGMTLTVRAKRVEDFRPKVGLDLMQRDGSTG